MRHQERPKLRKTSKSGTVTEDQASDLTVFGLSAPRDCPVRRQPPNQRDRRPVFTRITGFRNAVRPLRVPYAMGSRSTD